MTILNKLLQILTRTVSERKSGMLVRSLSFLVNLSDKFLLSKMLKIKGFGTFSICAVSASWSRKLALVPPTKQ